MRKHLLMVMVFFVFTLVGALFGPQTFIEVRGNETTDDQGDTTKEVFNNLNYKPYDVYLSENADVSLVDEEVSIDITNFTTENMEVSVADNTVTTGERGKITWTFDVQTEGFYNLKVDYFPIDGKSSTIQREIHIDDEIPFQGAHQIAFTRIWEDEGPIQVKKRNEIRPNQIEMPTWQSVYVSDSQKYVQGPYQFYLSKGTHSLSFVSVREPLLISGLKFDKAPEVLTYEDYLQDKKSQYPVYLGDNIIFQAERIGGNDNATVGIKKSSPTLYPITDFSSSKLQPYHPYDIRLNAIGGYNWRVIGDWISWDIEVAEEGLYQLSLSEIQNTNRGVFSARELKVNGEVPFKEAYSISFKYNSQFKMYTLGGTKNPYLFHLKKGVNNISFQVTLGPMGPIIQEVQESVSILNEMYRQITQLTGATPDKYIDYQLEMKLPHMQPTFEQEGKRLATIVKEIQKIAGDKSDQTAIIDQMAVQLKGLAKDPEDVINQIMMLEGNIAALSTWILQASEQPLEIDYYVLSTPHAKLPTVEANIFEKIYFTILRFVSTFFVDYNDFSSENSNEDVTTIEVWTQSGRDQAQILRNLIDNTFTPDKNINVNLKLVPQGVVLPATLAGKGPDVVLNLFGDMTVNFAMRDAAADLTQFDDFDTVASQFKSSAFDTLRYQDGVYGLPETQSFYMLFYRKDILNDLELEVPTTWDDVHQMIPILEMHNYQFYMPTTLQMYATLLYQMGGEMYLGEGNDLGIESGLFEDSAIESFKMWTDFYTSYKLPIQADFANRFRTGEMPIGVFDYTTYNTLAVFAPEIAGLWGFAPLPGIEQTDGSINNLSVSTVFNSMMLEDSDEKEASWEFLKWWTSTETQVSYGRALEGVMGAAARYNTANVDALTQLPWSSADYDQLITQFDSVFTIPEVPGGYITARQVDYALRAVLNEGQNPREALFEYVKDINRELTIKRNEFGLSTKPEKGEE